jgi:competence protein ComEC
MKIITFPLVRLTIGLVLGILLGYYLHLSPLFAFGFTGLLTICFLFYFISNVSSNNLFKGIFVFLFSVAIGINSLIIHTAIYQKTHYAKSSIAFEKKVALTLVVREKLKSSKRFDKYICLLQSINHKLYSGKIILNLKKDSLKDGFGIGDKLFLLNKLVQTPETQNPSLFNYAQYLSQKQLYAQVFSEKSQIKVSAIPQKDIYYYAFSVRQKVAKALQKNNFSPSELAVTMALLLGQQQDIEATLLKDYQYAGVVHALSVSGLHVGLVLLMLNFLLQPFANTRRNRLLKTITIVICLFLFAVIAGLAPSIIRAVVMFSFVAIGAYLNQRHSIYYALVVSIGVILLFEPYYIFDVGFQLSYISLFFMIWLQPLLASLWTTKSKIKKFIWDIVTVSIAAQIGTLPLCLYYFHQFSGLFLIANLFVIPYLYLVMGMGILALVLIGLNSFYAFFATILSSLVAFLNIVIHKIAKVDFLVFTNIPFGFWTMVLTYVLLASVILMVQKGRFISVLSVLIAVIALQLHFFAIKKKQSSQKELIVYNLKNQSIVSTRIAREITVYQNQNAEDKNQKYSPITDYCLANNSVVKQIEPLQNLLYFEGKKVIILESSGVYIPTENVDLLLLTQSPKVNLSRVIKTLKPKMVIADGTNYKYLIHIWQKSCVEQKIKFSPNFYKLDVAN